MLALPAISCHREKSEEESTIRPAEPAESPNAADTETAMTETIELVDDQERSPAEGGVLTDDTPTKPSKGSGATTTTNPNAPRKSPSGKPPQP